MLCTNGQLPKVLSISLKPVFRWHVIGFDVNNKNPYMNMNQILQISRVHTISSAHHHVCVVCVVLAQVFEELEAGGVFEESCITPRHMFLSVHDAVLFAQHKPLTPVTMEEVNQKASWRTWKFTFAMVIFSISYHSEWHVHSLDLFG